MTLQDLLVRISSGGMGVFHVKGWGPKSLVSPSTSKPRETKLLLVDVSDNFNFFLFGGEGKGRGVRGGGRGGFFNSKERGGGFPRRRCGRGKGAGGMSVGRGGGLNMFFRGRNSHQVIVFQNNWVFDYTYT